MKIHDYIKHSEVVESPTSLQPVVFSAELLEPGIDTTFTGMNKDRSVAVALYHHRDLFVVVLQKPKRTIHGKISEDCPELV